MQSTFLNLTFDLIKKTRDYKKFSEVMVVIILQELRLVALKPWVATPWDAVWIFQVHPTGARIYDAPTWTKMAEKPILKKWLPKSLYIFKVLWCGQIKHWFEQKIDKNHA